ncbi:hypothetical protein [Burkholderia pseudomallei]|uniref:hypothetical protein n=1 Tax=Burkholderia pseudomallei TaxID=28450 RepID=UPI0002E528EB|nr:hypothetical protein [Burkholderia pseudomallei]AGZ32681.1 hypothetical protein BBK_4357 [Burkholderia pseudomallei NCTC 13179]
MLTQDQINQAVSEAMPDILVGLKREISENAISTAKLAAWSAVQTAVTKWINENLVPDIIEVLAESKDGLIASAPLLAQSINAAMLEAFTDTVKKKLETSWERKRLFEALLG